MIDINNLPKIEETRTYTLRGQKETFDIYNIPLELLRYNEKNGRIASYITEYIDEQNSLPNDNKEFNELVEKFIVESASDAFKKTKNNMKQLGQIEPAIVLNNGIVVDGNRRFSALRQLRREGAGAEFGYLKAAIINESKYSDKEIKTLELNLQHARESKVDYNPTERTIDIYRDLIKDGGQFTPAEYAHETDSTESKINEEIRISKLLLDYLEYIKEPFKFHIARNLKLDGPLREVDKILRSNKVDDESKEDVKELLFANILTLDSGDITRKIRDLRKVIEKPEKLDEMLQELEDTFDDLDEELSNHKEEERKHIGIFEDTDYIRKPSKISVSKEITEKVKKVSEKHVESAKISEAQKQPIEALSKAIDRLNDIDSDAVKRLALKDKEEFSSLVEKADKIIGCYRESK